MCCSHTYQTRMMCRSCSLSRQPHTCVCSAKSSTSSTGMAEPTQPHTKKELQTYSTANVVCGCELTVCTCLDLSCKTRMTKADSTGVLLCRPCHDSRDGTLRPIQMDKCCPAACCLLQIPQALVMSWCSLSMTQTLSKTLQHVTGGVSPAKGSFS